MLLLVWRRAASNELLSSQKFNLSSKDDGLFRGLIKSPAFCNEYKEEPFMLKSCKLSFASNAEISFQVKEFRYFVILIDKYGSINPMLDGTPPHPPVYSWVEIICIYII